MDVLHPFPGGADKAVEKVGKGSPRSLAPQSWDCAGCFLSHPALSSPITPAWGSLHRGMHLSPTGEAGTPWVFLDIDLQAGTFWLQRELRGQVWRCSACRGEPGHQHPMNTSSPRPYAPPQQNAAGSWVLHTARCLGAWSPAPLTPGALQPTPSHRM